MGVEEEWDPVARALDREDRELLGGLFVAVNTFIDVPLWLLDLVLGIDRPRRPKQGDYGS